MNDHESHGTTAVWAIPVLTVLSGLCCGYGLGPRLTFDALPLPVLTLTVLLTASHVGRNRRQDWVSTGIQAIQFLIGLTLGIIVNFP